MPSISRVLSKGYPTHKKEYLIKLGWVKAPEKHTPDAEEKIN